MGWVPYLLATHAHAAMHIGDSFWFLNGEMMNMVLNGIAGLERHVWAWIVAGIFSILACGTCTFI
jgi:hypothetical protein